MRVKIYARNAAPDQLNELRSLLEDAGCEVIEDVDDNDELPLIILIIPELDQNDDLEDLLINSASVGRLVIGVWPKDAAGYPVPDCLDKYSSHQIKSDPEILKRILAGDDLEPVYQNADGTARPAPRLDRNKC